MTYIFVDLSAANSGQIPGTLTYNRQSQLFTLHFKVRAHCHFLLTATFAILQQGSVLVPRLQVATRRPTTATEFYNGYISAFENKTLILESVE